MICPKASATLGASMVVTAVAPKAVFTNASRSSVIPRRWRDASYVFRREPHNSWQNRRQASTFPARMGNVRTIPDMGNLYLFRAFDKIANTTPVNPSFNQPAYSCSSKGENGVAGIFKRTQLFPESSSSEGVGLPARCAVTIRWENQPITAPAVSQTMKLIRSISFLLSMLIKPAKKPLGGLLSEPCLSQCLSILTSPGMWLLFSPAWFMHVLHRIYLFICF